MNGSTTSQPRLWASIASATRIPALPSSSPRRSGGDLAPPGEQDRGPERHRPHGHVGVRVAGRLGQAALVEEGDRARRRRRSGSSSMSPTPVDAQREGARQERGRVAAHRPEREQREHQRVERGLVGALPGDVGLPGPQHRQVAPGRVAGDQRHRQLERPRRRRARAAPPAQRSACASTASVRGQVRGAQEAALVGREPDQDAHARSRGRAATGCRARWSPARSRSGEG